MSLCGRIVTTKANGGLNTSSVNCIMARIDGDDCYGVYAVRDIAHATLLQSALGAGRRSHTLDILGLDLSNMLSVRNAAATINAKASTGGDSQDPSLGPRRWLQEIARPDLG